LSLYIMLCVYTRFAKTGLLFAHECRPVILLQWVYELCVTKRHSDKMYPVNSYRIHRIYRMNQLPNEFMFEQSFGWLMTLYLRVGRAVRKPRTGSYMCYKNSKTHITYTLLLFRCRPYRFLRVSWGSSGLQRGLVSKRWWQLRSMT